MGSAYQILGRTFQPHQLALATLGAISLVVMPNPFKGKSAKTVEIKGDSKEEEQFIRDYLKNNEAKV